MAVRQLWEDLYGLEVLPGTAQGATALAVNTIADATDPTKGAAQFAVGASHGVKGGWTGTSAAFNLLPADGHPAFKAPYSSVEKDLATGKPLDNVVSITPVAAKPENITIPVVFNAHNLSAFVKLLFQSGVSVAAGTTAGGTGLQIMTAIPYADATPSCFANLIRIKQDASSPTGVDDFIQGVIVTGLKIKGEEGGIIEGEVRVLPGKWSQADLSSKIAAVQNFDSTPPLKFEDLTVRLGGDSTTAGDEVAVPAFEIDIDNQAKQFFYNNSCVKVITLGKLKAEGSVTIPWNDTTAQGKNKQILDFKNGVDKVFSFVWGNPTFNPQSATPTYGVDTNSSQAKNGLVDNYLGIHLNAKITDYDENDIDDNPMLPVNFKAIQDASDTVKTIMVKLGYALSANSW